MDEAIEEFKPNLIIYNAGTDSLIGDPLGGLDLSPQGELLYFLRCLLSGLLSGLLLLIPRMCMRQFACLVNKRNDHKVLSTFFLLREQGIITRDEMVFRVAKRNNLSVAMVMSGGYQVGPFLVNNCLSFNY